MIEDLVLRCQRCRRDREAGVRWQRLQDGRMAIRAECSACRGFIKYLPRTEYHLGLAGPPPAPGDPAPSTVLEAGHHLSEYDWLASGSPDRLLYDLENLPHDDHRLRYFACACCRMVWQYVGPRARGVVEDAERLAAGCTEGDLGEASRRLRGLPAPPPARERRQALVRAVYHACGATPARAARWVRRALGEPAGMPAAQGDALRDLFGNPFRPAPALGDGVLAWEGGAVRNLARAACENLTAATLDPVRLGVLADALEEAGCQDGRVPEHLRAAGPHYRGCWAVELAQRVGPWR